MATRKPKKTRAAKAAAGSVAKPSASPWARAAGDDPRPAESGGRVRTGSASGGKRSFGGMGRRKVPSAYEAAADHPLVPKLWDPSPNSTAVQQRFMQVLARHLVRNESYVANLVRVMVDTHVGLGSRPVSRFEERDDAFMRISRHFDHDGDRSLGGIQRDVYWAKLVDGEVFLHRVDHSETALGDRLPIPATWQILRSEYVPHDFNRHVEGYGQFVNGICRVDGRVAWYAVYNRHPREAVGTEPLKVQYVPASEIYHLRDTANGGNRGEVMLASALLRAIKASTLEDSELRRKHLASLMSIAVYRPADDFDDFKLPSEEEVSDMIDAAVLSPGGFIEMPYGYKTEMLAPPDEGQNFERALRWQLMGVCASVGAPVHEVLGDWANLPERMARYMGQTQQRRADIVREDADHQVWERFYADATDYMMAAGIWLPPEEMSLADLYQHYWDHPPLPMASFKQELAILLLAEEKGVVDVGYIQKTLFGLTGTEVSRRRAAGFAQEHALGLVTEKPRWDPKASDATRRLLQAALEEEIAELDLLDQSELDTGSMQ